MHWPVAISGGPLILHRRATGCHPDRSGGICGCFSLPKAHGLRICQAFLLEPSCFHQLPFAGYFPCLAHNQIMHTPLPIRATAAPRPVCAVSGLLPGQVVGHAPVPYPPKIPTPLLRHLFAFPASPATAPLQTNNISGKQKIPTPPCNIFLIYRMRALCLRAIFAINSLFFALSLD